MQGHYQKTDVGRAELTARRLELSRTARNLLFVLDASRPAQDWLNQVQGASAADWDALERLGLVTPAPLGAVPPSTRMPLGGLPSQLPTTVATAEDDLMTGPGGGEGGEVVLESVQQSAQVSYSLLYDRLTASAREQLGMIKGYRFVLEVERCADVVELEALARRFVADLRVSKGMPLAAKVLRELGLPGQP